MAAECSILDCRKPACNGRGWCWAHYTKWRRYGDAGYRSQILSRTDEERFWGFVDRSGGPDACWPWTGCSGTRNYGSFTANRRSWRPARWLWEHNHGPIPDGLVVRHTCDNPPCCNPSHHLLGTPADNMADMVARERSLVGTRNHESKLTDEDVRQIKTARQNGVPGIDLAATYRVTPACISHIMNGRSWTHVTVGAES